MSAASSLFCLPRACPGDPWRNTLRFEFVAPWVAGINPAMTAEKIIALRSFDPAVGISWCSALPIHAAPRPCFEHQPVWRLEPMKDSISKSSGVPLASPTASALRRRCNPRWCMWYNVNPVITFLSAGRGRSPGTCRSTKVPCSLPSESDDIFDNLSAPVARSYQRLGLFSSQDRSTLQQSPLLGAVFTHLHFAVGEFDAERLPLFDAGGGMNGAALVVANDSKTAPEG